MKLYHASRSKARVSKGRNGMVRDCKNNASVNGSRWAVDFVYKASKGA